MIYEICHLVHVLTIKGTIITFCWVPSHCGLIYNDWADRAAKSGALCSRNSVKIDILLSLHEVYRLLENTVWVQLKQINQTLANPADLLWCKKLSLTVYSSNKKHSRAIITLLTRMKLNALKTKFSKNVTCICGDDLSVHHIIFNCGILRSKFPHLPQTLREVFLDHDLLIAMAKCLLDSPIYAQL